MSLTGAMFTGFTGIYSNGVSVDVVGDNLANLNTTSFKSQRTLFETLLYRTVDGGEGPSATSGGTLPFQIGTGTQVSSIQRPVPMKYVSTSACTPIAKISPPIATSRWLRTIACVAGSRAAASPIISPMPSATSRKTVLRTARVRKMRLTKDTNGKSAAGLMRLF